MDKKSHIKQLYNLAFKEVETMIMYQPDDFRIEQIEYDKSQKIDSLVVSFLVKRLLTSLEGKFASAFAGAGNYVERKYKEIKFDNNGNIKGIYIYSN